MKDNQNKTKAEYKKKTKEGIESYKRSKDSINFFNFLFNNKYLFKI